MKLRTLRYNGNDTTYNDDKDSERVCRHKANLKFGATPNHDCDAIIIIKGRIKCQ